MDSGAGRPSQPAGGYPPHPRQEHRCSHIQSNFAWNTTTGCQVIHAIEGAQQGRLAATRGAYDGSDPFLVYRQVDAGQGAELAIIDGQVFDVHLCNPIDFHKQVLKTDSEISIFNLHKSLAFHQAVCGVNPDRAVTLTIRTKSISTSATAQACWMRSR